MNVTCKRQRNHTTTCEKRSEDVKEEQIVNVVEFLIFNASSISVKLPIGLSMNASISFFGVETNPPKLFYPLLCFRINIKH